MKRNLLSLFVIGFCAFFLIGCQFGQTGGSGNEGNEKEFTLTFYDGEEVIQAVPYDGGDKIEIIEAPEKEGYIFYQWQYEDGGKFSHEVMPNKDLSAHAVYKKAFTYTFLDYDGTVLKEVYAAEGTVIVAPDAPEREREGVNFYDFIGWDKEFNRLTEDIVITALYEVSQRAEVTYEIDGGNFEYYSYAEVAADLLKDYNKLTGKSYTIDTLPAGAWENINFHTFFYSGNNATKWAWLVDYFTDNAAKVNRAALSALKVATSASSFDAMNSDYKYSISYEMRAFIKGTQISSNSNFTTADYSEYEAQNAIWEYYNEYVKEQLVQKVDLNKRIVLPTAYKMNYKFEGWYDNPDFTGNKITTATITDNVTFYAKFTELTPVSEIVLSNTVEELVRYDELQLSWEVLPSDAGNKTIKFKSSNPSVVTISASGKIVAVAEGTATITVSSYLTPSVVETFDIVVYTPDRVEVRYADKSYGCVGDIISLEAEYISRTPGDYTLTFKSSDESIAVVNNHGDIEFVGIGNAVITVGVEGQAEEFEVGVTCLSSELSDAIDLIVAGHESNVFIRYNLGIGSGEPSYYKDIYGSVNDLLFNKPLEIDKSRENTEINNKTGDYYSSMTSVEFITVHYTGNMASGADAEANADYFVGANDVSIHYTTGNDGVFKCLPHSVGGFHAGDSGAYDVVGPFEWIASGVMVGENDPRYPEITVSEDFYYEINGQKTSIPMPRPYNYKSRDTDHVLNADGTISSKEGFSSKFSNRDPESFINDHSLPFTIIDGEYYMGTTWWCYTQVYEGRICSTGGNRNSIGIESCVNQGSDLWYTWHLTAKLVAELMVENNLDITRVRGHHFFTAKDCPQPMLENDCEIWHKFLELVEAEYELLSKFGNATVTMESESDNVKETGRVIVSKDTNCITYTVKVEVNGVVEEVTLSSIVEGTYNIK